MPEPIEVTSNPIAISVEETVTALCEDMRKMHERMMSFTGYRWICEDLQDDTIDLGCGGEGSQ